jgi:putative solute:sodium symporter small subunit
MWIMFVLWLLFSFVIHMFVNQLNEFKILGFPLGFYMAAQGSLVAFVVMLFIFASRQDAIDRDEGVAED